MNELELLRKMWVKKARRGTKLIVPEITYIDRQGSLNNDYWAYKVTYAFRSALDIMYQERKKDKKPYMVWTQGPLIAFKEGDVLTSQDASKVLQVNSALPMGWDVSNNKMGEGFVTYTIFNQSEAGLSQAGAQHCTQMQFLELLICGDKRELVGRMSEALSAE